MSKQQRKQKWNKKLVAMLTVLLLSGILLGGSIGYLLAVNLSTLTYYGAGGQTESKSYLLFKDGSTYHSKNGTTGAIDYSSSSFATVFMNCQDAIDYGTISLSSGVFSYTERLNITKALTIEGNGRDSTFLSYTGANAAIKLGVDDSHTSYPITIKDLSINGTTSASAGIWVRETTQTVLSELNIYDFFEGTGIFIDGGATWVSTMDIFKVDIASEVGIHVTAGVGEVNGVNIYGGYIWSDDENDVNTKGFYFDEKAFGIYVWGTWVETVYTGLYLAGDSCSIFAVFGGIKDHHVDIRSTANANTLGVKIAEAPVINDEGIGTLILGIPYRNALKFANVEHPGEIGGWSTDERGYTWWCTDHNGIESWDGSNIRATRSGVTEASNQDFIAHLLWDTPTVVHVTVLESDATYSAQVYTTNATHFQLYLYDITASASESVDKTIMWTAAVD